MFRSPGCAATDEKNSNPCYERGTLVENRIYLHGNNGQEPRYVSLFLCDHDVTLRSNISSVELVRKITLCGPVHRSMCPRKTHRFDERAQRGRRKVFISSRTVVLSSVLAKSKDFSFSAYGFHFLSPGSEEVTFSSTPSTSAYQSSLSTV